MRFTRSTWLRIACVAPVFVGLIIGVAVILRANRVLHQAQQIVRSESDIAFTERQLPEGTATDVEFLSAAHSFQRVLLFDKHLFLVSSSALTELDDNGAVRHEFLAGRELPPGKLVAAVTATLANHPLMILATENAGLLGFDGRTFRQILPAHPDARAVTSMLATRSGRVLLGTKKLGVLTFDGRSFEALHPTLKALDVTALAGDETDLWVGTLNAGLYHFHAGQTDHFSDQNGLPDQQILSIAIASDTAYVGTPVGIASFVNGKFSRIIAPKLFAASILVDGADLYIGTEDQGLFTISLASSRPNTNNASMPDVSEIRQLIMLDGSIIAVTREAIFRKAPHATSWQKAFHIDPERLTDSNIAALARDHDGRLWVGYFDRGLDILSVDRSRTHHIEDDHVFCVNRILIDDQANALDIATANGLVRMNSTGSIQQVLTRTNGLIADHVTDVASYGSGLVVATPAGLTFLNSSGAHSLYAFQGLVNNHVYALGAEGDQLLAGTLGGISQLEKESIARSFTTATSSLRRNWVTAIVRMGDQWMIGTYGDGVVALDRDGTFHRFEIGSDGYEVNPNAMAVTPQHVFAGTLSKGLYVYDRATGRWRVIDSGLPSLNVTAIVSGDGYIYIGTDNGLVRIREQRLHS